MDVRDLIAFEIVALQGAMNGAAAALNTVQSNVTAPIRALEGERSPRFSSARRVALLSRLPGSVFCLMRETLRIGSLESVTAMRLTPVLVR